MGSAFRSWCSGVVLGVATCVVCWVGSERQDDACRAAVRIIQSSEERAASLDRWEDVLTARERQLDIDEHAAWELRRMPYAE